MKEIYADLHSHTNHSDGLLEIEELLKLAKEAKIEVLAITDHDTTDQYEEISEKAKKIGIRTVKGVEISCYDYQVDKKVHIVALFLPDKTPHKSKNLEMGYIDVEDGIKAALADGAIPILAHPCQYENYPEVGKYVSFGLRGIEISHRLMKEEDFDLTKDLAEKYDLIGSGGSDFHDPAKHLLGKFGLSKEEFDKLLQKSGKKL